MVDTAVLLLTTLALCLGSLYCAHVETTPSSAALKGEACCRHYKIEKKCLPLCSDDRDAKKFLGSMLCQYKFLHIIMPCLKGKKPRFPPKRPPYVHVTVPTKNNTAVNGNKSVVSSTIGTSHYFTGWTIAALLSTIWWCHL